MSTTNQLKDIPDSEVDEWVAKFKAFGYEAEKKKQANGKWTITAKVTEKKTAKKKTAKKKTAKKKVT